MSQKVDAVRALVTERLTAAAEEIFALVERTIVEYEEELCRSKEENQRKQQLLDSLLNPQPHTTAQGGQAQTAVSDLPLETVEPESNETLQIKLELDELSIKQEMQLPHISSESTTKENEELTDNDEDWERPFHLFTARQASENCEKRHDATVDLSPASQQTEKPFSCSVCQKRFAQKVILRIHMSTHFDAQNSAVTEHLKEKPFRCGFCGKKFRQLDSYSLHVKHRHTGVKPFSCAECGARFRRRRNAVGHMSVHTGLLPFKCGECDAQFIQKKKLVKHKKTHIQKSGCV
ncbi:hypothetical protein WMY93_024740 [Mugilogobius chulae]|uniref:C2H2-type domain-containing protein n=1 Tax=Mugilogobius chulae TaxID=88201 RepID=A0AAW0N0F2_9GOBI